jgi:ferredoxin
VSAQAGISRRALLGFLREREEPAPSPSPAPSPGDGFSLEAFYSARARSGVVTGQRLQSMTVRVRPQLCLAWQGSFCSTCSERCPVEDAIVIELGRPRVVDTRCNGCGLCVQLCPAPLNAFEFLPSPQQAAPP